MVAAVVLSGSLTVSARAQATFGSITGAVTDSSGGVLTHAALFLTNQGTNQTVSLETNDRGEYQATNLAPGTYLIRVQKEGFQTYIGRDIVLEAQHVARVDVSMHIGEQTTQVDVSAGAATIETETPTITSTLTSKELTDSPTNLRSTASATGDSGIFGFISLVPTGYQTSGARYSMGGARGSEDNFNVDGISSNSPAYGNFIGSLQPSFEMISQVSYQMVDTKAEFGQVVNVTTVTKSGSNKFHGSAFEYNRNTALSARDYFATSTQPNIFNDFGGSFGGPIKKDKLFFFLVYEGDRQHQPTNLTASVPTLKMRQGDFSELLGQFTIKNPYTGTPYAGNVITSQLNASALKWQSLFYPLPNFGPAGSYTGNYRGSFPQSIQHNEGDGRIDWVPTQAHHVYGRYFYKVSDPQVLDSGLPPSLTGYRVQQRTDHQFALSDTWMLTPQLVNEAKVGFSRDHNNFGGSVVGQQIVDALQQQGVPADATATRNLPSVAVNGFTNPFQLTRTNVVQNSFQYIDQLTYVRGNHVLKAGAEYKPQQYNNPIYPTFGSYSFDSRFSGFGYSDFLLGLPGSTSYTYNRPSEYSRVWFLSGFLQDDWKIRSNLTLNYGVRYDYFSPARDKLNAVANFDPATGALVVPSQAVLQRYVNAAFPSNVPITTASAAGFPSESLRQAFKLGFQPRVGFAWRPYNNDKFSVRGGYGFFRDALTADIFNQLYGAPFGLTQSYTNAIVNGAPTLTFTAPFRGSYSVGTVSVSAIDKHLTNPYVQQWNLTVEQNVGFDTGLRLSYVGLKATKLLYGRNINQVRPGTLPYNPANAPYQNYLGIYMFANGAAQTYNAFTAELTHSMHNGLMFEAAYTWAKNLTNADETGDVEGGPVIENAYDLRRERGDARYNPHNRFISSVIYELPFGSGREFFNRKNLLTNAFGGWQITANFTAQTGQFYTPAFSGFDPSNTNTFGGRPDIVGNPNPAGGARSLTRSFNVGAFAVPANGRFGTARNGSILGPGLSALNSGLYKTFQIRDSISLRIEGSFTNVLNHPNFGAPDTNISDGASAGVITSTSTGPFAGARQGQLGGRLSF